MDTIKYVWAILFALATGTLEAQEQDRFEPFRRKADQTVNEYVRQQTEGKQLERSERTDWEYTRDTMLIEQTAGYFIEEHYTTQDMYEKSRYLAKEYDRLLNKYYRKLMEVLNEKQQNHLREAQLAWLKFRDKESVLIRETVGAQEGSMWGVVAASENHTLIQSRLQELYSIYRTLAF